MGFKKYTHLERFGSSEVSMIEIGNCHIFPKIDGTNGSIWIEGGEVQAGSRNRHLSIDQDNAGFLAWAQQQDNIKHFLSEHPTLRLYGEWLVPHSLRTYRESAWRKFYVFDVVQDLPNDETSYLSFEEYKPLLDRYGIDYIPPLCVIKNTNYDQLVAQLEKNVFLIEDGKGFGEGIVIKNYGFKNKYGRTAFAKIVTSEFKEQHSKVMRSNIMNGTKMIEEEISEKYVTKALCEKVLAKIDNESGWSSKQIPRLLNTVYYDLVKEDCWEFTKEFKNPVINFKTLQHFTFQKVKENLPQLF